MAILGALLSLVMRQLSTIVQAIFGWSITALFGKLPSKKQTALSVALALSVAWPLLVIGCFVPRVAAWVIAFVPIHKWLGDLVLRIVWIVLALLIPLGVGAITRWITPKDKLRRGLVLTLIGGYPITVGYLLAFVITAVTVPVVKILSAVRRWDDCHVYVQPKEGRYEAVLDALRDACGRANASVVREDVPQSMRLASMLVLKLASPFLVPIVEAKPQRLRGDGLEIYLYPADLLMRGIPQTVAHARAAMTRTRLEQDAYLVTDLEAQRLQDEMEALWDKLASDPDGARQHLQDLSRRVDRAPITFEEWTTLEASLRRFEQRVDGRADTLAESSDGDARQADGGHLRNDVRQQLGQATRQL